MKVILFKELKEDARPQGRLLGIDFGTKTIGLALSNAEQTLVTPLTTIKRTKLQDDLRQMAAIISEFGINAYVIGWPLNMDGSLAAACDRVQSFADELQIFLKTQGKNPYIYFQDERLSTKSVDNLWDNPMHKTGNKFEKSRKNSKKRDLKLKGATDATAAMIILQDALNK